MNRNKNWNVNIFGLQSGRIRSWKISAPVTTTHKYPRDIKVKEDRSCATGRKKNQRYSSSFVGNTTSQGLTFDKEFDDVIGNNSKARTTSSVHVGEDITLCWIETTTIKEDKNVWPPKRLVIREYTISFENSATIPDRYLECERLEGEVTANDPEIGKTALFEVIDEDTKASKVVNFTTVSNVGDVLVWQHKKVKCGVGPVVNKNIIEWNDDSENPKKRVEIKVSPEMHQLSAKKPDDEPCTEEVEGTSAESSSRSTEFCENTTEDGACEMTMSYDKGSSSRRPEVETSSNENGSEEILNLPTGHKTSTLPYEAITQLISISGAPSSEKSDGESTLSGEEECEDSSDPECATQASGASSTEESSVELWPTDSLFTKYSVGSSKKPVASTTPGSTAEQTVEINVSTESDKLSDSSDVSESSDWTTESTSAKTAESSTYEEDGNDSVVTGVEMSLSTEGLGKPDSKKIISTTSPSLGLKITKRVMKASQIPGRSSSELPEFSPTLESFKKYFFETSSETYEETSTEKESLEGSFDKQLSTESSSEEPSEKESFSSEQTVTINTIDRSETVEPEIVSKATLIPAVLSTTSLPMSSPTVLSLSDETDYTCENSENCASVTSASVCDETGDCSDTTTSRSCESGECLDETSDYTTSETSSSTRAVKVASTTMISEEAENGSTNNVYSTTEARRSTPLTERGHKFTLKVKILLEHVNDRKETQHLVEVEKKLLLNENPYSQRMTDEVFKQLKSLNDSVNVEAMDALLNCTSLKKLTKNANFIGVESVTGVEGSGRTEDSRYSESDEKIDLVSRRRRSLSANLTDTNDTLANMDARKLLEPSRLDLNDSSTSNSSLLTLGYEQQDEQGEDSPLTEEDVQLSTSLSSKKEAANSTRRMNVESGRNVTRAEDESAINETKMAVIRETLPGIQEDVSTGLRRMVSQLTQGNLTLKTEDGKEEDKVSLMGILANPKDSRMHSRRKRAAAEEVGRWSHERIRRAPSLGGNLRSFTEFTLYKMSP